MSKGLTINMNALSALRVSPTPLPGRSHFVRPQDSFALIAHDTYKPPNLHQTLRLAGALERFLRASGQIRPGQRLENIIGHQLHLPSLKALTQPPYLRAVANWDGPETPNVTTEKSKKAGQPRLEEALSKPTSNGVGLGEPPQPKSNPDLLLWNDVGWAEQFEQIYTDWYRRGALGQLERRAKTYGWKPREDIMDYLWRPQIHRSIDNGMDEVRKNTKAWVNDFKRVSSLLAPKAPTRQRLFEMLDERAFNHNDLGAWALKKRLEKANPIQSFFDLISALCRCIASWGTSVNSVYENMGKNGYPYLQLLWDREALEALRPKPLDP